MKGEILCELNQRANRGWYCALICVRSVRLRNVCYTCTDVSSIPHIVFLESMYIVKRIMVSVSLLVSLYIITLCGMFFIAPILTLLRQGPEQGKYFYQALLYFVRVYFLPSLES